MDREQITRIGNYTYRITSCNRNNDHWIGVKRSDAGAFRVVSYTLLAGSGFDYASWSEPPSAPGTNLREVFPVASQAGFFMGKVFTSFNLNDDDCLGSGTAPWSIQITVGDPTGEIVTWELVAMDREQITRIGNYTYRITSCNRNNDHWIGVKRSDAGAFRVVSYTLLAGSGFDYASWSEPPSAPGTNLRDVFPVASQAGFFMGKVFTSFNLNDDDCLGSGTAPWSIQITVEGV
jgi:hypothetical protein